MRSFRAGALNDSRPSIVMVVVADIRTIFGVVLLNGVVHMTGTVKGRNDLHMIELRHRRDFPHFVLRDIFAIVCGNAIRCAANAQSVVATSKPRIGFAFQPEAHLLRKMDIDGIHI